MSGNHSSTTLHNVDFLIDRFNLKKEGDRAVFTKGSIAYLSPGVKKNNQGYYWFDIREANLNFIKEKNLKLEKLIIRIVPNLFIIVLWEEVLTLMTEAKIENSGLKKWEFLIEDNFTKLVNRKSKAKLKVECVKLEEFVNI